MRVGIVRVMGFVVAAIVIIAGASFIGITKLEENDSFCASCHSEPEATYFNRAQAAAAVDLASAHALLAHSDSKLANTRCIECHTGTGLMGRAQAVSLGIRDAARWFSGTATQPAKQVTPISDANCLKCHIDTPKPDKFDLHFHQYLAEWQTKEADAATCVTCHAAHITGGNAAIGFLQQQATRTVCDRCHKALANRESKDRMTE